MSLIVDHWRGLVGAVHPLDTEILRNHSHTFNLDFPPPAFIGDVVNAPVVLLDANGGYDPIVTPSEFPDAQAVSRYIELLHDPQAVDPASIAPYYGSRNYAHLIREGVLALVNAVAYRSPSISKEPENRKIAGRLPSTAVHRKWLRSELMSQADSGDRLIIAHRTRLWALKKTDHVPTNLYFTTNPVSADLSKQALSLIGDFVG